MPVQVGSAYGKIGLGTGDFTAGVGIVLTSLDILQSRVKETSAVFDNAFSPSLKSVPATLDKVAAAGNSVSAVFEKTPTAVREFTTATSNLESKIGSLSERIGFQKRQFELLEAEVVKALTSEKATVAQYERKQLALDRLSASIRDNEKRLASYKNELEEGTKGTNLFNRALDQLESVGKKAGNVLSGIGGSAKRAFEFAAGNLIADGIQAVTEKIRELGAAMVNSNADFQTYEGQFAVLLGSVEEATARLEELEEFGRTTPFELPEVIKASRQLEVLTKGALSTGEGLRLVGDVAAGVNEPLENVSMWIGRAYDAIQAGRPFGEAAMRLQEMGALSGEARNRLEDLQKQGADASTVWKVLTDDLSRFDGQMDVLSGTFNGVKSNLQDTFNKTLRIMGKESFDVLEEAAKRALKAIDDNQEEIIEFAEDLGHSLATATEAAIQLLEDVDWTLLGELITSAAEKAGDLAGFLADAAGFVGDLTGAYAEAAGTTDAVSQAYTLTEAYYAGIKAMKENSETTLWLDASVAVLTGDLAKAESLFRAVPGATEAFTQTLIEAGHATGAIPLDQFNEELAATEAALEESLPPLITFEEQLTRLWTRVQEMANADNPLEAVFAPEAVGRFAEQLEARAEATEEYAEKSREVATQILEEERNYRDAVNENLDELREARNEYNADVAEKGRELAKTLAQVDKDYTEKLKALYAERRTLDEDYTEARKDLSDEAAAELLANDEEFNREVESIRAERIAAERELQDALLESEIQYQAERSELEREHAEEVRELTRDLGRVHEDYTRDRGYRHQDHTDKLDDLEEKHAKKVIDLTKDIEDAENELADSRRDINEDLQKDLDDLEEDRKKSIGDIQKEINELLSQAGAIGVDMFRKGKIGVSGLSGLDKDQKKDLQELLDQLAEEQKAYDDQAQDLRDKAQEQLDEEQKRHDERVADLQERLDEEQALYDDAVAKEEERFRREEEAKDIAYARAVEKLEERLTKENEAYDRQLGEIVGKHQAELDDLNTKYAQANESLNQRFTAALAAYDTQKAAINTKLAEELTDLQTQHDAAVAQLIDRFNKELAAYEEKRAELINKNAEELNDLRASYDERVAATGEKLDEIKQKHRDAQIDLRDQARETTAVYQEELQKIAEEFTKPASAIERIEESVNRMRTALAQPLEIKFSVTGLPEEMIPRSPSPLEQSLTRTVRIMQEVSRTPMIFDVQQRGGGLGAARDIRKGGADSLVNIASPLVNIESLRVEDIGGLRNHMARIKEIVNAQIDEFVEQVIEITYRQDASGEANVIGERVE